MWIFTTKGFYSAVQHSGNPGWIHLRSRFKGDLERLLQAHKDIIGEGDVGEIRQTPGADYGFRVDVRRELFARIVSEECLGIDYPNFKSACSSNGFDGRHGAYLQVWSVMRRAQEEARKRRK